MLTLDDEQLRVSVSSGCRFYGRCNHRMDVCLVKQPPHYTVGPSHHVAACYLYDAEPVVAPSPDDVSPTPANAEIRTDNQVGDLYEKEPEDTGVV